METALTKDAVAAVAAELEIRNLLAGVLQVADTGDLSELSRYYTEEATWTTSRVRAAGLPNVTAAHQDARNAGVAGPDAGTRHLLCGATVSIDPDGLTATARSLWSLVGRDRDGWSARMVGEFVDDLVHGPDGWRIARRVVRVGN